MARRAFRIPPAFLLLPPMLAQLLLFACRSQPDLVLDDPAFRSDMIQKALEGEKFKIGPDDIDEIRKLFTDNDPEVRRAGVILAAQAKDESLRPVIFEAATDPDPEVAAEATVRILESESAFRPLVLEGLTSGDPDERVKSIELAEAMGGSDIPPLLADLFGYPDSEVTEAASRAFVRMEPRSSPLLDSALGDENPRVRATALATLSRYGDPSVTPTLIEAFGDPNPEVRREAQFAVYRLGEAALPYLHEEVSNTESSYEARLSSLQVIQGIRSPESLPLLLNLLDDDDERIRQQAESILGTYGTEAISALTELYNGSADNPEIRIRTVRLMGEIGDISALPSLVGALNDPRPEIAEQASRALRDFGPPAYPRLLRIVEEDDTPAADEALSILRDGAAPGLFFANRGGEINEEGILLLIRKSTAEELAVYLESVESRRVYDETILNLKTAWDRMAEYRAIDEEITSGRDPYLLAWRQRRIYSVQSREALKESFALIHDYFETRNPEALKASRKVREESRLLETEARRQEALAMRMDPAVRRAGEEKIARYLDLRDSILLAWDYAVPALRPLARAVFADRGLDPEVLAREAALIDG